MRRCSRCSKLSSGRARAAVDGRAFCETCYEDLRRGGEPDEGPALFRCGVCGTAVPAEQTHELLGQTVCARCVSARPSSGQAPAGRAPPQPPHPPQPARPRHGRLLAEVTCPHCWHQFAPADVLWASQHADLLGDPVLGPDQQLRFRASRFNERGEALDLRDLACQQLACPHCHLVVPRVLLDASPVIVSVIGAPASGKSHFLAAMAWELRRVLTGTFGAPFNDVDPDFNRALNEYEETLFLPADVDRLVAIRKTELQGELYDQIHLGQQVVTLPRPFLFSMRLPHHPGAASAAGGGGVRVLCLYDNAGEHFQPGMDTAATPGTQHLGRSAVLLFLFDPTQHPRLREHCRGLSEDPQLHGAVTTTQRQETVLLEAVARIRRHTGLSAHEKHDKPLLVLVSKADIWARHAGVNLQAEPFVRVTTGPQGDVAGAAPPTYTAVDLRRVEHVSSLVRAFLAKHAPNVITAAEDSFGHVVYLPVSSLGSSPSLDAASGMLGVRSRDIRPHWVTVPLLYVLARSRNGGIPGVRTPAPAPPEAPAPDGDSAAPSSVPPAGAREIAGETR